MRVVINGWFWDQPHTGSGQYTRRLVERLAALGEDLDVVLVVPARSAPEGLGERLRPSDFGTIRSVDCPRSDLGKVWFEQALFPRICSEVGADVAHVPYWAPPLLPSVPTLVTVHDLIPLALREYRGGLLVRTYTSLVATATRSAALVLTDSEASRRDILAHLALPADRVHVVYLAADDRFRPDPAPDDEVVRSHYGLPEQYVLYLGGFDVRKNVGSALAAYTWAGPVIGEECPLVVAGPLPERDSLLTPDPRRQARQLDLAPEWVRFVGRVPEDDKPALYRGAVAFLYPSRYEGFGLPPLEAMACGTPVVGSNATSIPEVVGNGGVLLHPDDAAGMAGALIQLVKDELFRAELGRRALAQAARFSWERTAADTLAAYRQAL